MSESNLINEIKNARKTAIEQADTKHAQSFKKHITGDKQIGRESPKAWLLAVLLLSIILAVTCMSVLTYNEIVQKPRTILHTETTMLQPIIQEKVVNITEVQVTNIERTEVVLKAEDFMTCIGKPNSQKMECYKNNLSKR